jgi:hypothetical protein
VPSSVVSPLLWQGSELKGNIAVGELTSGEVSPLLWQGSELKEGVGGAFSGSGIGFTLALAGV